MKTVRRPPYPKWNPGYFPCSSLTTLPLSSRRPSVSFGGFGISLRLPDAAPGFRRCFAVDRAGVRPYAPTRRRAAVYRALPPPQTLTPSGTATTSK